MKITEFAKHTKTLSASLTTLGILAFMCAVGVLTVTKNSGSLFTPTPDEETGAIPTVKERIVSAYDDMIVGFDRFISVYGITQRVIGTSVYDDAGYTYLIRDKQDFIHFNTLPADAKPFADAVCRFRDAMEAEDIPFLYLQSPTKEIEGYTDYPPGIDYASTDNARAMRDALRTAGVELVSFAEEFAARGIDPKSQFYRTDHHWTTQSAFEAFRIALPYLNERYGWSLDASTCQPENWTSLYQPQSFLGSIGRRIGVELAGLDDYTYLEPAFETSYDVFYPPTSRETPYWSGSFHHTMVRDSLLYADNVEANRYASYFQYDYAELVIENKLAENDLHVVIIKDSFALPFTAFLSTAVHKITMLDLRGFEGSVADYMAELHPDLVIMMYGNGSFTKGMYEFFD